MSVVAPSTLGDLVGSTCNQIEEDAKQFVSDLAWELDLVAYKELKTKLPEPEINQLTNKMIKAMAKTIQGGKRQPGYHVIKDRGEDYLKPFSIKDHLRGAVALYCR